VSEPPTGKGFHPASPVLRVRNLAASLEYYVTRLGFRVDWEAAAGSASVSRDRCHLMLSEGDQGHPGAWVWIGVADVEPLHAEYVAAGVIIRHPPTNYPWALEMQVLDPDGNVLRLGSDRLTGVPHGEWLDMHGVAWAQAPDGGWRRVAP
jgi:catechol 2,3-dioxygenase-like lactoylglutathione lyase family enzyme